MTPLKHESAPMREPAERPSVDTSSSNASGSKPIIERSSGWQAWLPENWSNAVWAMLCLMGVGLLLRMWGLNFGLPNDSRPDEGPNLDILLNNLLTPGMLGGDWRLNPHFFSYGSLYYYLLLIPCWLIFSIGQMQGQWVLWQEFLQAYYQDPTGLHLMIRGVSVLASVLTIPAMYALGKQWRGPIIGWLAAAFMATSYLMVRNAHFGTPDSLMCLGIVLSLHCLLRLNQAWTAQAQPEAIKPVHETWFIRSCIAIGLSVSIKYPAAILLAPLGVSLFRQFLNREKPDHIDWAGFIEKLLIGALIALAAFLVTSPWTVLDSQAFFSWLNYESAFYTFGLPGIPVGWQFYPTFALPHGIGVIMLSFSLLGIVLSARDQEAHARWTHWMFWSVLIAGYLMLGPNQRVMSRYAMPLVPVLLLYAALAVVQLGQAISRALPQVMPTQTARFRQSVCVGFVALFVVAQPVWSSVQFVRLLEQPDTRTLARDWLMQNAPQPQPIATGPRLGQMHLPLHYGQLLLETGPNNIRRNPEIRIQDINPRVKLTTSYANLDMLRQLGVQYVVVYGGNLLFSNPPWELEFFSQQARLVAHFSPYLPNLQASKPEPAAIYDPMDAFFAPFANFEDTALPGPDLYIFDLAQSSELKPPAEK